MSGVESPLLLHENTASASVVVHPMVSGTTRTSINQSDYPVPQRESWLVTRHVGAFGMLSWSGMGYAPLEEFTYLCITCYTFVQYADGTFDANNPDLTVEGEEEIGQDENDDVLKNGGP